MLLRRLFLWTILFLALFLAVSGGETRDARQPAAPSDEPEVFVAEENVVDMRLAEGIVYWSTRNGCPGFEFLPVCRMRTKPAGDGWQYTFYNNASGSRDDDLAGNFAADEFYAYWISDGGEILRQYRGTGSTPTTIATLEDTSSSGEIAVDENYIYWTENLDFSGTSSDSGKIFRAPKDGGSRQLMRSVSERTIRQLQADGIGGVLSISDNCPLVCFPGILYRTFHNGSAFVSQNSSSWNIQRFTTDGTTVYWATTGGDNSRLYLERAPLSNLGSSVEGPELATSSTPEVRAMAVDGASLYWHFYDGSAGGPVFRLAKDVFTGGSPTALTSNRLVVDDLVSNNRFLFWKDANAVYRLATDAAAYQLDASIADIEVTQGIQDLDNDVPLVQDRSTMVRVYPGLAGSSFDPVQATVRLHGSRGGSPLPGSPLEARSVNTQLAGADRDLLEDTANFVLPGSWLQGDVTLRADISVFGLYDTNTGNNSQSVAVSFTPKSNICMKFLPLRTVDNLTYYVRNLESGNFTPGFVDIVQRFNTLWPAPRVPFYTQSVALRKPCFLCAPNPSFNLPEDNGWVIFALLEHNVFDDAPDWCDGGGARTHYVGMVHPGVNTTSATGTTTGGFANLAEPASYVKMTSGGATPYDSPRGGGIMAQEIGHNYNGVFGDRWKHVNCGLPSGDDPYDGYPYNPADIGPLGPRTYWGFDRMTDSIIQPDEASDYMSYCTPRWTSDHNWRGAMDHTNAPAAPLAAGGSFTPRAPNAGTVFVTGEVARDESDAELVTTYRLPSEFATAMPGPSAAAHAEEQPAGNYALQLVSDTGTVLVSQTVTPTLGSHEGDAFGGDYLFFATLPDDAGAATLRLNRDGSELARRPISPNAPVVSVLEPVAGDHYTDTFSVSWSASDADGDPLHYAVQYSADGGNTWQLIGAGLTNRSLALDDTSNLPGSSDARIRVIAGDGISTGMATSSAFTLEPHAPWAIIQAPAGGAVSPVHEPVLLEGYGLDPEEGLLTSGNALSWQVAGPDGAAGNGESVSLTGLAPGAYTATLTATDGDGRSATASANFVISPKRVYDGAAPLLDGYCDDEAYAADLEPLLLHYDGGDAATVRFVHAGGAVFVCFSGLQPGTSSGEHVGLKVDVDNSAHVATRTDDKIFYLRRNGVLLSGQGNNVGAETFDAVPQGLSGTVSESNGAWAAEMRIEEGELGGWNHLARLQAGHYGQDRAGDDTLWPASSGVVEPRSWGLAALGRLPQNITFPTPPDASQDESPLTVAASSSSGLPVSFTSQTPEVCETGRNVVDLLAPGTCTLLAFQGGNGSYSPAKGVARSFEVTAPEAIVDSHVLFLPTINR